MLTQLFTPQSVLRAPASRMTLNWYIRLDIVAALMVGADPLLPDDWIMSLTGHLETSILARPDDVALRLEERGLKLKFIFLEMSKLYAKRNRGDVSPHEWVAECDAIAKDLKEWRADQHWHPWISNSEHLIKDLPIESASPFPAAPQGIIYDFPFFSGSVLMCIWHTIVIMHAINGNTGPERGSQLDKSDVDIQSHANAIGQILDAVENWPSAPKGVTASLEICLLTVAIVLHRQEKHRAWLRRKFARLELKCG